MNNITLIFTRHKEGGDCNSIELLKIIESINPEVIFEELSYTTYSEIYKEKCLTTLESNAIKKYLQKYSIEHIPVDTFILPKHYHRNVDYMYKKVFNKIGTDSYELKELIDKQTSLENRHGFSFLNSDHNDEFFKKVNLLEEGILKSINDEKLFEISRLNKEVIENREKEILNNIYNYSKEHKYNHAILFVGSGHRSSMIRKIENRRTQDEIEINWIHYNS